MRRGRSGIGGWRTENHRHFRPRGGGLPHFRPPRGYGMPDGPRFLSPGPRLNRPHFNPHHGYGEGGPNDHDRINYRPRHMGHHNRGHHAEKSGPRNQMPFAQAHHKENHMSHENFSNYYDDRNPSKKNDSGHLDRTHPNITPQSQSYSKQPLITSWYSPPTTTRNFYDNKSPNKAYRHHDTSQPLSKPLLDYPGHRPPASDHYDGNPKPVSNIKTSFSRSVDDTVDIVRKRLLNRNESQILPENNKADRNYEMHTIDIGSRGDQYETATKKRTPRQKLPGKPNCNTIKNNIVHQLFKMDKDKIHKFMDNPNSSMKFEYAISSLITESQMSFNKHLRSVAEKSLCSSSTEFIQNDTIYEDTFMKQMQCIMDPQDTVLLEDVKPLVMAELRKFLQLDDLDQSHETMAADDNDCYRYKAEHRDAEPFPYDDVNNYEEQPQETYSDDQKTELLYDSIEKYGTDHDENSYNYRNTYNQESEKLFERRTVRSKSEIQEEQQPNSKEVHRRKSFDVKSIEEPRSLNLFDTNVEQLSEYDDPFAELDKQYHVPVDPNFLQNDVCASPQQSTSSSSNLHKDSSNDINFGIPHPAYVQSELDFQSQNIIKSPLQKKINESMSSIDTSSLDHTITTFDTSIEIKTEPGPCELTISQKSNEKCYKSSKSKDLEKKDCHQSESTNNSLKSSSQSNSRKRSTDQRPSHRKEKRKKSESSPHREKKSSTSKSKEKDRDSHKPYIYSYFTKVDERRDSARDIKKVETKDKAYSDKYVKRKEEHKKKESPSKRCSNSTSLPLSSPKDNSNINDSASTANSDVKVKLQPIDMFVEKPKKVILHQAHRNTATPCVNNNNAELTNKITTPPSKIKEPRKSSTKMSSKETQTISKTNFASKLSQTEKKKTVAKSIQTDEVNLDTSTIKCTNPLERMKQIDLEIQVLLQEKFKLYSSLESKDSENSMQTLGMTVLDVTPVDIVKQEDLIDITDLTDVTDVTDNFSVDEFTELPIEDNEPVNTETELKENIALPEKRARRLTAKMSHIQEASCSSSSVTRNSVRRKTARTVKTPNICLIEQIIMDDRPLEEIIPLEQLENTPAKKKGSMQKKRPAKKAKIRKGNSHSVISNDQVYQLKDCSVVVERLDIENLITKFEQDSPNELHDDSFLHFEYPMADDCGSEPFIMQEVAEENIAEPQVPAELIEEANNIHFDMLDFSEDIVIGHNYEIKLEGKETSERNTDVPITEEIILDNSQSSCDDLISNEVNQGEDLCKTYDYSTDENLRRDSITVAGNGDAVLAIECVENNFIAACLDGNVYHFNGDGQLINTLRGSNLAVTCLTIVREKSGTTVYTGSLDSRIRYYDLETGAEKGPECNVLSPIQTMDRAWDTVFVGTRTGFVLQFECKNNMLIPVSTVKFSEQSILAIRALREGPRKVLLVAARSENVTIKDALTGLLLRTLEGPKMTVYTLLFEDGKIYCGTSSHQIHVFDYSSGSLVGSHEGGKGAVCLRATGGLLFAGCYDGCIYVYRDGETRPLAQLRGPSLMLLSLAVVGSKIIAGYKDRSLYIWKIPLNILQEMIL